MRALAAISEILDRQTIVILVVALPLLVSVITPILRKSALAFYTIASLFPVLNVLLLSAAAPPRAEPIFLSKWFVFTIDRFSYLYGILVNLCWFLTLMYSSAYVRHHFREKAETFHRYLAVTLSFVLAAGFAFNFFTMVLFYTLTIPMVLPLVTIKDDRESLSAGRVYFLSTFLPALLIIVPIVSIFFPWATPFSEYSMQSLGYGPTASALLFAGLIIGFSKNSVFPFQGWLPRTSVAPAPVSALVHSVAAVQTATLALLRIGVSVYGSNLLVSLNDDFFQTGWLTYLCGGTALYTAVRAYLTPDLKKRFSYSTVGQLSYIMTAVLVGTEKAFFGAVLHIVTHGVAKMNLFFVAGVFSTLFGSAFGPKVNPILPRRRWLAIVASISGLSITGFPLMAGYFSKDLLLIEEVHKHHYAAAFFLITGSLINLVYIWPIIKVCFAPMPRGELARVKIAPIPPAMTAAILICTVIVLTFSQYVYWIQRAFAG